MEKILVEGNKFDGSEAFASFSLSVTKGHSECGDAAFVFSNSKKVILAVFDGVSGESGSSNAAQSAAKSFLQFLSSQDAPTQKSIHSAFFKANLAISFGYTTATVLFLSKSGKYSIASVGDSPAYLIRKNSKPVSLIPLSRAVGSGNSIMKFFSHRNIVTSVLGKTTEDPDICLSSGTLKKGDVVILASDGLSDNLYVTVKEGFVTDCSGSEDLAELIGPVTASNKILDTLVSSTLSRMTGSRTDKEDKILVPKKDDLTIAVLNFNPNE